MAQPSRAFEAGPRLRPRAAASAFALQRGDRLLNPDTALPTASGQRRFRRRYAWPAFALLLAALTLVCLTLWLLKTDAGGRWLLQRLPGVTIQEPSGSLFDDAFSARQVRIRWGTADAQALLDDIAWRGARWQWRPDAGAWLGVQLDELRVRRIRIQTGTPSTERLRPPASLRLPLHVQALALRVDELHLDDQTPLRDLQMALTLGARQGAEHLVSLQQLRWEHVDASGQARIQTDAPFVLESSLLAKAASGPPWQATAGARGPLSSIDLKLRLNGQALDNGPPPALDAQAQLRPFENWPLGDVTATTQALDLASVLPRAPRTRLDGRAAIRSHGLRQPVDIDIQLDNGVPARFSEGGLPLHALRLSVKADPRQPERLVLGPFDIEAADSRGAAGRWTGAGVWDAQTLTLQTRLTDLQPQRLDSHLAPMRLSGPVSVVIKGLPSPDPRAMGQAKIGSWKSLTSQFSGDLEGRISGAPDDVRLAFEGEASADRLDLRNLQASSGPARAALSVRLMQSAPGRWQLRSQGALTAFDPLTWFPGPETAAWGRGPHRLNGRWELDLSTPQKVLGLPMAQWLPAVQGQADLKITDSRLAGLPLSADLQLRQDSADSTGQRSRARGDIRLAGATLRVEGSGDPLGSGSTDRTQLRLSVPALAELAPLAALLPAMRNWTPRQGELQLQLDARGRWPALGAEVSASANGLRLGELSLAKGQLQGRIDLNTADELSLRLEATRLGWQDAGLDLVKADLRGTLAAHRFEAEVSAPVQPPPALAQTFGWQMGSAAQARLNGSGSWVPAAGSVGFGGGGRWAGQLERLWVSASGSPAAASAGGSGNAKDSNKGTEPRDGARSSRTGAAWLDGRGLQLEALLDPAGRLQQFNAQPGRASIGIIGLRWTEARWQAQAEGPASWRLQAEVEPLSAAPLLQSAPQSLAGSLQWTGDLRLAATLDLRAGARFEADARVFRESGDLLFTDGGKSQALGLTQADLRLSARDGLWRLTHAFQGQMLGQLQGELSARAQAADRWPPPSAPLEGQVQAQVPSLAAWAGWLPPGWRLLGELQAQARVSGTVGAPGYTGFVQAQRVGIRNLLQGVDLHEGQMRVALEGDTARVESLSIRAGEGQVNAEGSARFGANPSLQLTARADKLRVLGRADRQLVLSGQAALAASADRLRLDGRIVADSGLFDLARRDAPALDEDVSVNRSEDVEAAEPARREPSPRMRNAQVALDIDLGERLRLRGRGLDTGLAGTLKLTAPGGRMAISGTVRARTGTYAAYGQRLEIERGLVSFSGPLDSARLDILALRSNLDQRVGVSISGSALDPRVRLYSEPEMAESDKLSWLVLGRGPEGLGRTDTALLQRAALALLAGEGEGPTDRVMRNLGLDEFSIRQTDGEVRETVVSLGKQLSRRWYVGYERGVNATSGTWQLIYRAAQRFTLRAQSGQDNSLDMIWTWRFGQPRADSATNR